MSKHYLICHDNPQLHDCWSIVFGSRPLPVTDNSIKFALAHTQHSKPFKWMSISMCQSHPICDIDRIDGNALPEKHNRATNNIIIVHSGLARHTWKRGHVCMFYRLHLLESSKYISLHCFHHCRSRRRSINWIDAINAKCSMWSSTFASHTTSNHRLLSLISYRKHTYAHTHTRTISERHKDILIESYDIENFQFINAASLFFSFERNLSMRCIFFVVIRRTRFNWWIQWANLKLFESNYSN